MYTIYLPLVLLVVSLGAWFLPPAYPIFAAIALGFIGSYFDYLSHTGCIIILILAINGYYYMQPGGERNSILRINTLIMMGWAIASQNYHGQYSDWVGYLHFVTTDLNLTVYGSLEKILVAILLISCQFKKVQQQPLSTQTHHPFFSYYALSALIIALILAGSSFKINGISLGAWDLLTDTMYITLLIFSDEVIFHLILQNWFKQIVTIRSEFLASWLPIALAAFFYAISQYYLGPLAVIAAIFGGAIYGFIYQKSGKIELAILVHIAVRLALGLIFTFGIADKVMPLLY